MSKIFLSCDEANHTCDKTQYNDATILEKIKLSLHLAFCSACRKYTKNNAKLTKMFKQKPVEIPSDKKEALKTAFEKELQNHQ